MTNPISDGWQFITLGEICNIAIGGTPSRSVPEYWDLTKTSGNAWVSIRDLNKPVISETSEYISEEGVKRSNVKLVRKGTVLMSFKLSVGRVAYAGRDLYTNEAICAFIPKNKDALTAKFLYQGLQHWDLLADIDQAVKGVTLNKEKINNIEALLPPISEQQKIATILSSVDDVIEKTRAQIDKLKDLKTGMMHELLTKGIGHTEFKDSPVGRIPKEWKTISLGETGKWKGGGTPSKNIKEYWVGNIPWVSPKDMKSEFISSTEDQISENGLSDSSTNLVNAGSILIVARSGILKHTLPVAIAARDLTINQDMKALTVKKEYSALYIYQYLLAFNHQILRSSLKAGNTVESLDFNEFSKILIPYPPREEQEEIANAVNSIAERIRSKNLKLNALINSKKALMQDLLTGKVRVNTENHQEERMAV